MKVCLENTIGPGHFCILCQFYKHSILIFYYPVDISTTVFSYSRAVQYHAILHGMGVIARVLLHGCYCTGVIARVLLHGCYCTGPGATRYPSNYDVL